MKTRRLYYEDEYLHAFTAKVIAVKPGWVELDQTAFYPEGGGQPADHGWLNDFPVSDTQADPDGTIWHRVGGDLPIGSMVAGRLDWLRRFDHMQQHTAEHVLSQAFWQLSQATNVGFHLGEQAVTIDLDRPDLGEAELRQAEELANAVIRSKRAVRAKFVAPEELSRLDLRKPSKVKEDIRLVIVDDFDICPCGGTHVRDLGEVGLLKILSAEKRKGMLRVSLIAGQRAYVDYQEKHQQLQQLSCLLSQPVPQVFQAVEKQVERIAELEKQVKCLQANLLEQEADQLLADAEQVGAARLICRQFCDRELEQIRDLTGILAARPQTIAIASLVGDSCRLLLASSPDLGLHAGNLLKPVVAAYSGKGGGSALAAQGTVPVQSGEPALLSLKQAVVAALA